MRVWVKFRSRLGGIRKHQGLKKCACGPCRAHPYRRRTAARRLPPLPWPCMLWRGARKKRRCFRSEHCQASVFRWDRQPVPRVLAFRVYYIMLRSRCKASIMYNKGPVDKVVRKSFLWILLRSTARRIHLSRRSSSYVPQAKLQQIDGQISAVLPGRGRCLYALSKTAELF